jgi:hypothetical protein
MFYNLEFNVTRFKHKQMQYYVKNERRSYVSVYRD